MVIAVTQENASRCGLCGTSEWEWEEDPFAYHPVIHTCPGCQKKKLLQDSDTPRPAGSSVRLVDKHTAERLEKEALEQERPVRRREQ